MISNILQERNIMEHLDQTFMFNNVLNRMVLDSKVLTLILVTTYNIINYLFYFCDSINDFRHDLGSRRFMKSLDIILSF